VVFQEPRLLGHLDVLDNVALPLRAAGIARGDPRHAAAIHLEEMGITALTKRRVQGLSSGEQQRVAVARALSGDPDLLLLDEPLAALDPNRRNALRRVIRDVQRERQVTTVIVTHDRSEAADLGDSIALMLEGRIVQHDEPRALFERPVSAAVARFFGVANLIADAAGTLAIRPERVRIDPGGALRGTVLEAHYAGDHVRLIVDCGGRRIQAHVPPHTAPHAGQGIDVAARRERLEAAIVGSRRRRDGLRREGPWSAGAARLMVAHCARKGRARGVLVATRRAPHSLPGGVEGLGDPARRRASQPPLADAGHRQGLSVRQGCEHSAPVEAR